MTVPLQVAKAAKAARAAKGAQAGASAARSAGAGRAAAAMPPPGTKARQQRMDIERIKRDRNRRDAAAMQEADPEGFAAAAAADDSPTSAATSSTSSGGSGASMPSALTDRRGEPGWMRPDPVRAANSGAGFVLGLGVYMAGLVFLRDGTPGLKRWLAAKFLNRTEGGPTT